jgi:hypothetical protein
VTGDSGLFAGNEGAKQKELFRRKYSTAVINAS